MGKKKGQKGSGFAFVQFFEHLFYKIKKYKDCLNICKHLR